MAIPIGLGIAGIASGLATGFANTGVNVWSQKDAQAFNAQEALKQREWSSAEAQKQRDYEERLSNTAYQRALADMSAAGINPNVLAGGGQVASTPSSSIPSGQAASSPMGRPGAFDFNSVFSSAAMLAAADDKNVMNKIIAEMYATNSFEINKSNLAFRKAAEAARMDFKRDKEQFNQDFKKVSKMDKNSQFRESMDYKNRRFSHERLTSLWYDKSREAQNKAYRERSVLWAPKHNKY